MQKKTPSLSSSPLTCNHIPKKFTLLKYLGFEVPVCKGTFISLQINHKNGSYKTHLNFSNLRVLLVKLQSSSSISTETTPASICSCRSCCFHVHYQHRLAACGRRNSSRRSRCPIPLQTVLAPPPSLLLRCCELQGCRLAW